MSDCPVKKELYVPARKADKKLLPMGKGVGINDLKCCEDLTLEEAKQFDCCKDLTDDEIKEFLGVLKEFTEIAYAIYTKQKAEEKKQQEKNDDYKLAA